MSSYPSRLVLSLCLALALLPFLTGQSPSPQDKTAPEKGKQVRTDLCGDRLPEGAIARLGTNKFSAKITDLAVSRDGKTLIAVAADGSLSRWDMAGQLIRPFAVQPGEVDSVALSPDGKIVAVARRDSDGRTLALWNLTTDKEIWRQRDSAFRVAFSPDGKLLAVGCTDGSIVLRDAVSGAQRQRLVGHRHIVLRLAFSADGRKLTSTARDDTIRLWNVGTGKELLRFGDHEAAVETLAISPDGQALVAQREAKWLGIWDAATGKERFRLPGLNTPEEPVQAEVVAISPDGKLLAASARGLIQSWDLTTGRFLGIVGEAQHHVRALAFAPDSRVLISGGWPSWPTRFVAFRFGRKMVYETSRPSSVQFWDARAARAHPLVGPNPLRGDVPLFFTADSSRVVTRGPNTFQMWETTSGRWKGWLPQGIPSPDGKWLACTEGRGTICLYDLTTAKAGRHLRVAGEVTYATFSPDSKLFAASADTLCIWDVATGKERLRLPSMITSKMPFHFSANGQHFLTRGVDEVRGSYLQLWDLSTGKEVWRTEQPLDLPYALTADGKTLVQVLSSPEAEGAAQWIVRRDVGTGREVSRRPCPDPGLAFFDHPQMTLSLDATGQSAMVWGATVVFVRTTTGRELWRLEPEDPRVVVFSPDGRTLATAGVTRDLCLWEVATGQERCRFRGHSTPITSLVFSPDGRRVATMSEDEVVLIWDVTGKSGTAPPDAGNP